jgi:hypothetical protein
LFGPQFGGLKAPAPSEKAKAATSSAAFEAVPFWNSIFFSFEAVPFRQQDFQ